MSSSAVAKRRASLPRASKLCVRCSKINLKALFAGRHSTILGRKEKNLGPLRKWTIGSCSLCSLLATALQPPKSEALVSDWELHSFSSTKVHKIGWDVYDTAMISVQSGAYYYSGISGFNMLVPQTRGAESVRVVKQDVIDWAVPRSWLQFCQDNHTKKCALEPRPDVPFFKLIDCKTRRVVAAQDQPYVTLSYVWGSASIEKKFYRTLPANLPLTIEDAITATRNLGLRYLWIDRYCIDQQNETEVKEQVSRMDVIYQSSVITLIATAGSDPSFGLPGVSSRMRRFQQAGGMVGKHLLLSTLDDPRPSVKNSTWARRGWTYQEAILSRRRLVFTEDQLYFECYGMYCFESLNHPLKALHTIDGQGFRAKYRHAFDLEPEYRDPSDVGPFPRGFGTNAWDVLNLICEYTKLELKEPSDILNAILGILRRFATGTSPVLHCWGVPILPPPQRGVLRRSREPALEIWSPTTGFITGLSWSISHASRRQGFPSWSWTGWVGQIRWDMLESQLMLRKPEQDIRVSIELLDGAVVDVGDYRSNGNEHSQLPPSASAIHVTGWATRVKVKSRGTSEMRCSGTVGMKDGRFVVFSFQPDDARMVPPKECTGIRIFQNTSETDISDVISFRLLIVGLVGGRLERIGTTMIDAGNCDIYGPNGRELQDLDDPEVIIYIAAVSHGVWFDISWNWTTVRIE